MFDQFAAMLLIDHYGHRAEQAKRPKDYLEPPPMLWTRLFIRPRKSRLPEA